MTLPTAIPLDAVSPLSKVKQEVSHAADGAQTKALPGKRWYSRYPNNAYGRDPKILMH